MSTLLEPMPIPRFFPSSSRRRLAAGALGLALASIVQAGPADWRWRQPLPQGNELMAMTGGFGLRIAVGVRGAVVRSMFDDQWEALAPVTDATLNDIAVCNGAFVAVGNGGVALRSADIGASWTVVPTGTTADLSRIVCGAAGFAALGRTDLLISADGLTWTAAATGVVPGPSPFFDPQYAGVLFADGRYLVEVSQSLFGPLRASILESADAMNWQLRDLATPSGFEAAVLFLRAMDYGNGVYTLIHNDAILTSTDAQTWTWHSVPLYQGNPSDPVFTQPWSMSFDPVAQHFVGVADLNDPALPDNPYPLLTRSSDGATWDVELATDAPGLQGLHAINGSVYGRGTNGTVYRRNTDGTTTQLAGAAQATYLGAVMGDEQGLLAVGGDRDHAVILASTDGATWHAQLAPSAATVAMRLTSIVQVGPRKLATGNGAFTGGAFPAASAALFAKDGSGPWAAIDLGTTQDISHITGIAADLNGTVVVSVVFDGEAAPFVLRSSDQGATWNREPIDADGFLAGVQHTGGRYIARSAAIFGPSAANLYASTDGLHWTAEALSTPGGSVVGLAVAGDVAIALVQGQGGCSACPTTQTVLRSIDDGPWTQTATLDAIATLGGNPGGFFASTADGRLYRSADGTAWSMTRTPSASRITGLASLQTGATIAITDRGHILEGPPPSAGDTVFSDGFE